MTTVTQSDEAPSGGGQRYLAMDGLRGLAALSVVALHLKSAGMFPPTWQNAAVDMFFMLSGFVIAEAYETRIRKIGVARFFQLRVFRLYPCYLLSLVMVGVFAAFIWLISSIPTHPDVIFRSLAFQLFLLPTPPFLTPADRAAFVTNGAAWSLFWEVAINLLYAAWIPRLRTWHLVAAAALGAAGLLVTGWSGGDVLGGSDWQTWQTGGFRVLFGFPLGVLLHRLPRAPWRVPFVALAGLAAGSLLLPPLISILLVLPLVVWLAASSTARNPAILALGELSYPVYVLHGPGFLWLTWLATRVLHLPDGCIGPFNFIGVCVGAWIALIVWDRPVRNWLRREFGNRPRPAES